jgi:sulfur carrier protein ThiS
MKLHLGGYLGWYDPQRRSCIEISLAQPARLLDVIRQLGIPLAEVSLASINGKMVSMHATQVCDDDVVELHPPLAGG